MEKQFEEFCKNEAAIARVKKTYKHLFKARKEGMKEIKKWIRKTFDFLYKGQNTTFIFDKKELHKSHNLHIKFYIMGTDGDADWLYKEAFIPSDLILKDLSEKEAKATFKNTL